MQPFVDTYKVILIRPEEKDLGHMEAVTKDGIEITFKGVSVMDTDKESSSCISNQAIWNGLLDSVSI